MARRTVFRNGLRVITVPRPENLTATVLVLVETGSKYENKEQGGISHFLEHMCFKGTKKRPRAIDIVGELDALGAQSNAFTTHEFTGYFAKVDPEHLPRAIDIVSDIYLNQVFRENEIRKERGVIIEEINMYQDDPKRKIYDNLTELLYGDQPAGWNVAGTKETVSRLSRKDFIQYRRAHYVAEATVIIVAGRFNERKILPLLKRSFALVSARKKEGKLPVDDSQKRPAVSIEFKASDQTHLLFGARAFPVTDPRVHALEVLAAVLGGGMSSRLFQRIRDVMGAAYYVRAMTDLLTDHGYLAVATGSNTKRAEDVLRAIVDECKKLTRTLVPARELARVKEYLVGRLSLSLETTDEITGFYGGQEILKRSFLSPEAEIARIRAVTAQQVREVARAIFRNERLNLALIGPMKDAGEKASFERILAM